MLPVDDEVGQSRAQIRECREEQLHLHLCVPSGVDVAPSIPVRWRGRRRRARWPLGAPPHAPRQRAPPAWSGDWPCGCCSDKNTEDKAEKTHTWGPSQTCSCSIRVYFNVLVADSPRCAGAPRGPRPRLPKDLRRPYENLCQRARRRHCRTAQAHQPTAEAIARHRCQSINLYHALRTLLARRRRTARASDRLRRPVRIRRLGEQRKEVRPSTATTIARFGRRRTHERRCGSHARSEPKRPPPAAPLTRNGWRARRGDRRVEVWVSSCGVALSTYPHTQRCHVRQPDQSGQSFAPLAEPQRCGIHNWRGNHPPARAAHSLRQKPPPSRSGHIIFSASE